MVFLIYFFSFSHIEDLLSVSLVVFFFFCIGLNEPSIIAGRNGVVGARLYFFFLLKASKCVYVCECVSCRAHLSIMKSQNSALFAFWSFFHLLGRERERERHYTLLTVFIVLFLSLLPTYLEVISHISLERKRIFDFVVIVLVAQDFGGGVKKQSVR